MKTFYIYNIATDEYIGEVKAIDTVSAEFKAIKELNIQFNSDYVAAFSEKF